MNTNNDNFIFNEQDASWGPGSRFEAVGSSFGDHCIAQLYAPFCYQIQVCFHRWHVLDVSEELHVDFCVDRTQASRGYYDYSLAFEELT